MQPTKWSINKNQSNLFSGGPILRERPEAGNVHVIVTPLPGELDLGHEECESCPDGNQNGTHQAAGGEVRLHVELKLVENDIKIS